MPAALELAPKLAVVVDLPVLDDVDGAVLVPDRLVTGLAVDDRETPRGERHRARAGAASPAAPSTSSPKLAGPRWTSVSLIAASRSTSAGPCAEAIPQIPHIRSSLERHSNEGLSNHPSG